MKSRTMWDLQPMAPVLTMIRERSDFSALLVIGSSGSGKSVLAADVLGQWLRRQKTSATLFSLEPTENVHFNDIASLRIASMQSENTKRLTVVTSPRRFEEDRPDLMAMDIERAPNGRFMVDKDHLVVIDEPHNFEGFPDYTRMRIEEGGPTVVLTQNAQGLGVGREYLMSRSAALLTDGSCSQELLRILPYWDPGFLVPTSIADDMGCYDRRSYAGVRGFKMLKRHGGKSSVLPIRPLQCVMPDSALQKATNNEH